MDVTTKPRPTCGECGSTDNTCIASRGTLRDWRCECGELITTARRDYKPAASADLAAARREARR